MKFMIIEGNVVGGHRIDDLGLNVPYQKEVRVHFDRASWSSDLSYALEKGLVSKKGVHRPDRKPRHSRQGPTKTKKPPASKPKKKKKTTPVLPKAPDETEELRAMNKHLMERLSSMAESQEVLMGKISELLEQKSSSPQLDVETFKQLLASVPHAPLPSSSLDRDEVSEEDEVFYIPSQIRSEKTKVSDKIEVDEGVSKGSGVDKASAALAAMRKGKKNRRKKGDSDDSES